VPETTASSAPVAEIKCPSQLLPQRHQHGLVPAVKQETPASSALAVEARNQVRHPQHGIVPAVKQRSPASSVKAAVIHEIDKRMVIEFILLALVLIIPALASLHLRSTVSKYSKVLCKSGINGKDTAALLLRSSNIHNVAINPVQGSLTDHYSYSLRAKGGKIALSEPVFGKSTLTAVGVAAHEVGHAVQHSVKYKPMFTKGKLIPVANFGSTVGPIMVMAAIFTSIPELLYVGIAFFSVSLLVSLITLPTEFNASKRALILLRQNRVISENEIHGTKKVLNAAAMTYVASTLTQVLSLLRLILMARRRMRR
jgi:Zn-dependent membrane protease YugP